MMGSNLEVFPDSKSAYERFPILVHKFFPSVRNGRLEHRGLHYFFESDNVDFYCVFKKSGFFQKFELEFPDFVRKNPGFKGIGESVNLEVLDRLVRRDKEVVLVFLYHNVDPGRVARKYVVYPRLFRNFSVKHGLVRKQEALNSLKKLDGGVKVINEVTASLPLKPCFFVKFEDWANENLYS